MFFVDLLQQPLWVIIWVGWMMLANLGSVLFWRHRHGRVVFWTFLLAVALMMGMYSVYGMVKLLGLAHILTWGPLLAWLLATLGRVEDAALRGYLRVLLATIGISLLFDAYDVFVWFGAGG